MSRAQLEDWVSVRQSRLPHPYAAEAPTSVLKPPEADRFGSNFSVCWTRGIRTYYFRTAVARDKFVSTYREARAIA